MYYPSSENKGADQLRGYREADLRLCFRLCRLFVFPRGGSYLKLTFGASFQNTYFTYLNRSDGFYMGLPLVESDIHLFLIMIDFVKITVYTEVVIVISIMHMKIIKYAYFKKACPCNMYNFSQL